MIKIFGYGEDALTLWALKKQVSKILKKLNDKSDPSNCLLFFRPSFGRESGKSTFGEFDAILAFLENIYLIESKWDGLSQNKRETIKLSYKQVLRHRIFSWYFINWCNGQYRDWEEFSNDVQKCFENKFSTKKIAPKGSLLAKNLEFVLKELYKHVKCNKQIKNVLLYFYDSNKSRQIKRVIPDDFKVINIEYEKYISGNFISLDFAKDNLTLDGGIW